mmetsp:Transcript_260/g.113  ORF Transcript_260/g.113 Transcript_260/m.113 type:complete len:96 (+) Transcript_260:80-367(+)
MKVNVEFIGLPTMSIITGKQIIVDFPGSTITDLVNHLAKKYGIKAEKSLLDKNKRLDMTIQVMIDDRGFIPRENLSDYKLKTGDLVRFMLLAGGG